MMDADAKLWWAKLRKQGELAALPPDYQFADFAVEGRPASVGENGLIVDQISNLAQQIRSKLEQRRSDTQARASLEWDATPPNSRTDSEALATAGDDVRTQRRWTFISFCTHDRKAATEILNELERAGVRCWIANRDVPYGRDYQAAIVNALKQADSMVLVFSNAANDSEDVAREVALAGGRKILILPVRIEDARPMGALEYQLATRQYIDLFDDRKEKMKSIIQALYEVRDIKSPKALGLDMPATVLARADEVIE
jgi:hypothetical protein